MVKNSAVLILAAGMGKRMRSTLPKVLHEIGGQPLLFHIIDHVREAAPGAPIGIVVGHGRELVEEKVRNHVPFSGLDISFIHQAEQKGTGHAARCAMNSPWGEKIVKSKGSVLVLPGDLPLLPQSLIEQMIAPLGKTEAMRLLTCVLPDPTGYGRIVRKGKKGTVLRITEEKDANAREKAIREVGASIYHFQGTFLKFFLERLSNKNAQGEYYLTDLVGHASRGKKKIDILTWANPEDVRGVNDPWELAQAGNLLNERCVKKWALQGVRFIDPTRARLDVHVELAEEVEVHPGAVLRGSTRVGAKSVIGPNVVLTDTRVGSGTNVKTGTVAEKSEIGNLVQLGPYAHLRPESVVSDRAKIGNFVELKKSKIGEDTSIAHLSYVGDAEVGRHVNIGCGFVTCNFDGRVIHGERKHKTIIEDDVFLGSDCQAVAPVKIGRGAYIASGSTITEDVPPEALAIARSRQVNKPGYVKKLKEKK